MDNMELLTKVYELINDQYDEIRKVTVEQAKRPIYEVELEERCFETAKSYMEVACIERIKKLRERVRTLEKKTDDLEEIVKKQQIALELYSEKLAKVEVELDIRNK